MMEDYVLELIRDGRRVDGRKLDELRPVKVETGIIKRAEGSAKVSLGDTVVLVGVKLDIGEPFPDTPNQGILITNAEFSPIASPDFESGPPGEDAIELARVVDRGIREGKIIDFEKLCIKEGEKVWMVFIDIHVLNHKGNLVDASALAAMAALLDAKFPKYDPEKDELDRETLEGKLPINHKVVTVTLAKLNGKMLVDPIVDEEKVAEATLTIGVKEDGKVSSMQKSGGRGWFSYDEVSKAIDLAISKSKELLKHLE
ncbi:MAG: exosome complex protein Rrp42 [Candidatus Aenigmarchaeota archaeon]|nr:exosome complex protein Rrp42 [Candidatus Aenigmarchaeota archaeon]